MRLRFDGIFVIVTEKRCVEGAVAKLGDHKLADQIRTLRDWIAQTLHFRQLRQCNHRQPVLQTVGDLQVIALVACDVGRHFGSG